MVAVDYFGRSAPREVDDEDVWIERSLNPWAFKGGNPTWLCVESVRTTPVCEQGSVVDTQGAEL